MSGNFGGHQRFRFRLSLLEFGFLLGLVVYFFCTGNFGGFP